MFSTNKTDFEGELYFKLPKGVKPHETVTLSFQLTNSLSFNPFKQWQAMGSPLHPSESQLAELMKSSNIEQSAVEEFTTHKEHWRKLTYHLVWFILENIEFNWKFSQMSIFGRSLSCHVRVSCWCSSAPSSQTWCPASLTPSSWTSGGQSTTWPPSSSPGAGTPTPPASPPSKSRCPEWGESPPPSCQWTCRLSHCSPVSSFQLVSQQTIRELSATILSPQVMEGLAIIDYQDQKRKWIIDWKLHLNRTIHLFVFISPTQ